MAASKDVLTVVGYLCINRDFRSAFFKNPSGTAEGLVGRLREDEVLQIDRLAGRAELPAGLTRAAYLDKVDRAFENVCMAITCPTPPCPDDY
jgi:hypothetical protein